MTPFPLPTAGQTDQPLMAGDFLTREEFLRRWEAHPGVKKAELIGGVVYMTPIGVDHGDFDSRVSHWLNHYSLHTLGCRVGSNSTWYMLEDAPQPDVHLRLLPELGGNCRVEGGYLKGAPELAAETAYSSSSYDLHQKKDLYEAAGVEEYVVLVLEDKRVIWHRLVGKRYQPLPLQPDGTICSVVFPGLWLDPAALLQGRMNRVLEVLDWGLRSPEHAAFVRALEKRAQS